MNELQAQTSEELEEDDGFQEPECIVCGCTEENGCPGGCSWVEDDAGTTDYDLCTCCLGPLLEAITDALNMGGEKSIAEVLQDARALLGYQNGADE